MGARLRVQGPQAGQRRVEAVRACLPWAFRLIRGWSHDFRIGVAQEVFNDLDRFMSERVVFQICT